MQVDFERISSQVRHKGERGRAREDKIRQFLADYLPARVAVADGEIVDHAGQRSGQMDVVIYDWQSTPLFKISNSVRLFPAETVVLAMQVKSTLTKPQMHSALENLSTASSLKRTAEPPQPLLGGYRVADLFRNAIRIEFTPSRIPVGIFGYKSPRLTTVADSLTDWMAENPRQVWPSFVVSLDKGTIIYGVEAENGSVQMAAGPGSKATHLVLVSAQVRSPLLMLYAVLLNRSQIFLSSQIDVLAHLGLGESTGGVEITPLPDASTTV
jgi:hypothetical protein